MFQCDFHYLSELFCDIEMFTGIQQYVILYKANLKQNWFQIMYKWIKLENHYYYNSI